jgi:hypothetical protein
MPTMTNQAVAERVPTRPTLIASAVPEKSSRLKWLSCVLAAGLVLFLAGGTYIWRAHLQNTIRYETVAVERGSI